MSPVMNFVIIRNVPIFQAPADLTVAKDASRVLTVNALAQSFYDDTEVDFAALGAGVTATVPVTFPFPGAYSQIQFTLPSSLTTLLGDSITAVIRNPPVGGIGGGTSATVTFTVV